MIACSNFGFDVSDHKAVDPTYGTSEDVRRLVDAIHEKGMRVLFDFIPNHTSDKNDWFIKSVNREDPYTDFYIWRDPKGFDAQNQPIPPNNWLSIFNGPAWRWNEKRRQFYYTLFTAAQPDLNYRNPKVRSAMEDVIQYWLDFGVDGFRVDFPAGIFEDEQLRDNPWVSPESVNSTNYHAQIHTYQYSLDEVAGLAQEWRSLLDRNKQKDGKTR
ncbi:maltase 1-like [Bemisia tabaci]|uniref:maltase 1-like n=1 Tax=Bemisia tabaci TaxID=7038 RepID=UPI003B28900F